MDNETIIINLEALRKRAETLQGEYWLAQYLDFYLLGETDIPLALVGLASGPARQKLQELMKVIEAAWKTGAEASAQGIDPEPWSTREVEARLERAPTYQEMDESVQSSKRTSQPSIPSRSAPVRVSREPEPITHKFFLQGTRANGLPSFLRQTAYSFPDLELCLGEDEGWINTVVYATVSGPRGSVQSYLKEIDQAVEQHSVI